MKYMVMECHLSYAVVLDEEGHFLKVANRNYEVGQKVTDIIEMQVPQSVPQKKKTNKWMYSLATMAACMVLMVTSVFQMGQMTYASVYMTINPEVRIDVNRNDVVVGLDGINPDGNDLIAGYEYKKKDLDLVMDELVDRAIDMGYLHEGGQISLVLDADSDEWIIVHSDTLTTQLNEYLNEKLSVTIEVTDTKEQSNQVVIPVTPEESDYGESNYGETNPTTTPPVSSQTAESDYNDSSYNDGQSDYGESDYSEGIQSDYGESDYGKTEQTAAPPVSSQPSESDYGESDYGDSDYGDGQSDYGESDYTDDSQSDYGEQSDYGTDDVQSDYDAGESDYNDAQSDYEEAQSDYTDYESQSEYDSVDIEADGTSDYQDDDQSDYYSDTENDYSQSDYREDAQSDYDEDGSDYDDDGSDYDDD